MKGWQRDHKAYFAPLNLTISFSWKPNIFTLDDRIMLDRYIRGELPHPDLVFLHKTSHDAFQRFSNYKDWDTTDYEKYINGRSQQMVDAYDEVFSDVPIFWRAPFYQDQYVADGTLNKLMLQIEKATRPHLERKNIRVLETYSILDPLRGAPKLVDILHPYIFVNYILLDAALSTICEHIR